MPEELDGRFRFTPEFRLLVACSWVAPPPLETLQAEKIFSLSGDGIDWEEFIALVDRHRVPALAYASLGRHAGGRLPGEVKERLKERSENSRKEALQLAAETVRLAKKFAAEGIDLLPLKGQLLSLQLFGDLGTRQTRDIDLMVKQADLDQADRLLTADGYRCTFPGSGLTARQKKSFMSVHHHASYVHDGSRAELELHWRYSLWTPEQVDFLWSRCRPREWLKTRILYPDDEALLLFLCDHGASHAWFRLKWLGDIAMMLARWPLQGWGNLVETAARLDLERVLAQAALLSHRLYGIPLPPPLSALITREKTALPLAHAAIKAILMTEADLDRLSAVVTNARYLLRLRTNPQYCRVLKPLLISRKDIVAFPLPGWLFWLYVPLRPLFWFLRHVRAKKLPEQPR